MNQHLTEQQLIDYQFKLADEPALDEARVHLDQCDECRQKLQRLVRKFAALDLLRDEITVSEGLLARTIEGAAQVRPGRAIWLYRVPALGAVAAALIVGAALLLVSIPVQDKQILPTVSPQPAQENAPVLARNEYMFDKDQAVAAGAGGPRQDGRVALAPSESASAPGGSVKAEGPGDGAIASEQDHRQAPRTPLDAATRMTQARRVGLAPPKPPSAAEPVALMEIAAKPPFAPASAIELVVLPRRENVQLTIYNGADLTLVRERRNLTLKRGWNWLQFMWANTLIDPTSLALEPLEHKDGVQVQQLVFPPRLRELGRWLIRSEIDGQVPFELTYFTSGLAWRAFYMGTLSQDEKTLHLEGYVRISNGSGEDYQDAQTRLVVGRVHLLDEIAGLARRQYPYGSPSSGRDTLHALVGDKVMFLDNSDRDLSAVTLWHKVEGAGIRKEGLSEYFLYTIEGTETIPNEWGKRLLSFEAKDIPVTGLYKYDEERWGTETIRFLSFANDQAHKLGETPIPDGTVRIYGRADEQGHLSYVGGMDVKYIPVGEEVELNLGPARLVEVKPALLDYRTESHAFDDKGNLSGWDEVRTWRIEIANTRPLAVDIEVTRGFETPYWILKPANDQVSYEKHDATHARFKLAVEPRSKRAFEYIVTTYHGTRQGALSNANQP